MAKRPSDIDLIDKTTVFQGYFRVDRYRLRHALFAGGMSGEIVRETFERGHAVAVLPYDPAADEVVLIEQFRIGAHAHGADNPWLLEIIAGIIDPGETPEDVARRESMEEAGLAIAELVPVTGYYPSPGALTEHIDVFCARVAAEGAGGIHGLDDEAEDIRVVVLGFDEAMAALDEGRIKASPAIIALQWLALNRAALRERWG